MSDSDFDFAELPSIRARVEDLEVGETFARAQRFDSDVTLKNVPAEVLRGYRLSMQGTTQRIEKRTGYKYTIETGEFRTQSRDIMAVLAVTRTQ